MDTQKRTRRGNGEAEITRRGDSFRTQVLINGRRHSVTGKTKAEVQRKRRELLANADRGLFVTTSRLTVAEYVSQWLESAVKHGPRPATYRSYEELMRLYVVPDLGNLTLGKLGAIHLQQLYGLLLEQGRRIDAAGNRSGRALSAKTVRNTHLCIHVALEQAVKWNLLARNVAHLVEPPRKVHREIQTLSREEVKQVLSTIPQGRWHALIHLAINTGMRQGELLGLRWQDVDLDRGLIRVRQQYGRDGLFAEPKTNRSRRTIDLPASTVTVLREHRVRQLEERLIAGDKWQDGDLVFTTYQGRPLGHRNVTRTFRELSLTAGVSAVPFHALRHTHATMLLADGVPVHDVSARLGHSSATMTLDVYGHVMPDAGRGIAARLEALFA